MSFSSCTDLRPEIAVIGAGPAGMMAAEVLSQAGFKPHVFDAMPSVGRKFLLAGIGGLNLTHSEDFPDFLSRYLPKESTVQAWLDAMGPQQVRDWAQGLGVETFVGSSGRVFPKDMKAAPLLRAWLHRLRAAGVIFHTRHRWLGWAEGSEAGLRFQTSTGERVVCAQRAVVLACGGGSWPRLGSDGAWVPWLRERGVNVSELKPSNCGFDVIRQSPVGVQAGWTQHLVQRHAGAALKNIALAVRSPLNGDVVFQQAGEAVLTQTGLEGSLVYAASATVREELERSGQAIIHLDLLPQRTAEWVAREVAHPRGSRSLSTHLKSRLSLEGAKAALLHEVLSKETLNRPAELAQAIKNLPITLGAARPIAEAISTAGGVSFEAINEHGMLRDLPGVFVAGEMIDWDAPTGGYLLTACLASGLHAGQGVVRFLG